MLMCNEILTLVHHVREPDSDRYELTEIKGASWYAKTLVSAPISQMGNKGLAAENTVKVRIPENNMPAEVKMQPGDYLIRGSFTSSVKHAPKDFADTEYRKIIGVSDNRRGRNPHWAVTGV